MSREIINYFVVDGLVDSLSSDSLIGLAMGIYKKSIAFEIDRGRGLEDEINKKIINEIKNNNYEW